MPAVIIGLGVVVLLRAVIGRGPESDEASQQSSPGRTLPPAALAAGRQPFILDPALVLVPEDEGSFMPIAPA